MLESVLCIMFIMSTKIMCVNYDTLIFWIIYNLSVLVRGGGQPVTKKRVRATGVQNGWIPVSIFLVPILQNHLKNLLATKTWVAQKKKTCLEDTHGTK